MEKHYVKYLAVIMAFLSVFFIFEILQVSRVYLSPGESEAGIYGTLMSFVSLISPFIIGSLIVLIVTLLILILYNRDELIFH